MADLRQLLPPPDPSAGSSFSGAMSQVNPLPSWLQQLMNSEASPQVTGGPVGGAFADMFQIPQSKIEAVLTGLGLAAGTPAGSKAIGRVVNTPAAQALNKWFGGLFSRQITPNLWNEATGMYEQGEPKIVPGVTAWRAQRAEGPEPFSSAPRFGTYFAGGTEGPRAVGGYRKPEGSFQGRTGGPNVVKVQYDPQNPFIIRGPSYGPAPNAFPSNVALEKLVGGKQYNQILNDVSNVVAGHWATPEELVNVNKVLVKHGLSSSEAREVSRYFETHDWSPYQVMDSIGNKRLKDIGYDSIMAQQKRYTVEPNPRPTVHNEFVVLGRSNASKLPPPPPK